jgi:hypothetical protein
MKTAGKIFGILLIFITVAAISLFAASFLLRDQASELILDNINKTILTRLDVGSVRLSLLRSFPKAAIELKDVSLLSSAGFNKNEFKGINTDTLLTADKVYVVFSITDLLKKTFDIKRITVSHGKIILLSDSSGKVNYMILKETKTGNSGKSEDLSVLLERVQFSSLDFSYINRSTKMELDGTIKSARLTSRIAGSLITLGSEGNILFRKFELDRIKTAFPVNAGIDLKMEYSDKGFLIKKGDISIEGIKFSVNGSITNDDILDIKFGAENLELQKARKYIPAEYTDRLRDYQISGKMLISGKLTGKYSRTLNPHFEINCNLENGGITNNVTGLQVSNFYFAGSYSNGHNNNQESAILSLRDIRAKIGTAGYSGDIRISNLHNPYTQLELKGKIIPSELKQYFSIDEIDNSTGYIDADLSLSTSLKPTDSLSVDNLLKINPEGSLLFSNLSIKLKKQDLDIREINGLLNIADDIEAKKLAFVYKEQAIRIDGRISRLPEWLAGRKVILKADADVHFTKLIPETFYSTGESGAAPVTNTALTMPDDMILDLRLAIDSLRYKTLPAKDISARILYKPGLLTFNSLQMNALGGSISGNGFIARNSDKSFITKGIYNISDININTTFRNFGNFGQDFIRAENLNGELTGNLVILMPADTLFNPVKEAIVAEGNYVITNGSLIDFEPVKELSAFVELSELENIHFARLENEFFIRNKYFYVPQMDVRSSAADLTINGKHSFDNQFEYHVKIRLSELLSKKRKKAGNNVSEFGVVEDDGLGRTSLLLKIESKGDEIKVGYDVKAAGAKVKSGIKSEKQTLKKILNEEYGLFKNDTIPEQKPAVKKQRFRITWDESDSLSSKPVMDTAKKTNTIKSLFRKK